VAPGWSTLRTGTACPTGTPHHRSTRPSQPGQQFGPATRCPSPLAALLADHPAPGPPSPDDPWAMTSKLAPTRATGSSPISSRREAKLAVFSFLETFYNPRRPVWLRAVNLPPTRWRELDRGLIMPLSTLLTLAVDADCPPVQVQVATGPDSGWLSDPLLRAAPAPGPARPCGPDAAAPGCARAARGRGLVGPRRDAWPAAARCRRRRGRPPTDGRDWSSRPDHRGGRPRPPAVARLEPAHGRGSSRGA